MGTEVERRQDGGDDLPTKLEHAFSEMSRKDKAKFQFFGFGMVAFSIGLPMIAALFVTLPGFYWIFSGLVFLTGVCFLVPRLGVYLLTAAPNAISKIIPSAKLKDMLTSRVDRRGDRESDGE